jgi:hypothetical protein
MCKSNDVCPEAFAETKFNAIFRTDRNVRRFKHNNVSEADIVELKPCDAAVKSDSVLFSSSNIEIMVHIKRN